MNASLHGQILLKNARPVPVMGLYGDVLLKNAKPVPLMSLFGRIRLTDSLRRTARPFILFPTSPYESDASATSGESSQGTNLPSNVLTAREDRFWRPADIVGSKTLIINLAEPRMLDSIGIVGEGLNGLTFKVESSTDGLNYTVMCEAHTILAKVNCAWKAWDEFLPTSARYVRLTFTGIDTTFRIAWVCLCSALVFPYLEEDFDPNNISEAGSTQLSPVGMFQGSSQYRTMRDMSLKFGTIEESEFPSFKTWANQCVAASRPFVFVPDALENDAYFCYQKAPKFSAPHNGGFYDVKPIDVMTRAR